MNPDDARRAGTPSDQLIALRLARRLTRSRLVRTLGLLSWTAAAVALTVFVVLSALSLSARQQNERDFGSYDASVQLPSVEGPRASTDLRLATKYLDRQGRQWTSTLLAQLQPSDSAVRPLAYLEDDWAGTGWRGTYRLVDGELPTAPGQIAVTPELESRFPVGTVVSVLSGHGQLDVVGVLADRYSRDAHRMLAAQGTWQTFDWDSITKQEIPVSAAVTLYWNDSDPIRTLDALAARGVSLGPQSVPHGAGPGWSERLPVAYQIPSVLLAIGSTFAAFALARRHQRRRSKALIAVGVPIRAAGLASTFAVSVQCLIGATLGVFAGTLFGILLRPLVDRYSEQPLSPIAIPFAAIAQWLVLTLISIAVASQLLRPSLTRSTGSNRIRRMLGTQFAVRCRRLLLALAIAYTTFAGVLADNVANVMVVLGPATVTAILLVPEIMSVIAGFEVPEKWSPKARLMARHIAADTWRPGIIVAVTIAAIGPGLLLPIMASTILDSENSQQVATAAPGQLFVTGPNGATDKPPQPSVVRELASAAPAESKRVKLYALQDQALQVTVHRRVGLVAAVGSVSDAVALSNGSLSEQQRAALSEGHILVWDAGGSGTRSLFLANPTTRQVRSVEIEALDGTFQTSWQQQYHGLVLTATARKLHLPATLTAEVFTGLSNGEGRAMKDAVFSAGQDVSAIYFHRPRVPYELPLGFKIAAFGSIGILLTVGFATIFLQLRGLRVYANRLMALGLNRRWIGSVMVSETLLLTGGGLAITLFAVVLPTIYLSARVPNVTVSVPWGLMGAIGAAWALTLALAFVIANHRVATGSSATE